MHGELTFAERALGIDRAREFYELEAGQPVSQRELARLLAADGYPVSQPHISKMRDTVEFLLPAIPGLLFGGLGKPQIERLIALRRSAEKTWLQHAKSNDTDFAVLFFDVLNGFDHKPDFSYERFQDELIHQMQQLLGKDYNWLKLDILDGRGAEKVPPVETPRSVAAPPPAAVQPSNTPAGEAEVQPPACTPETDLYQQELNRDTIPVSTDDQQALIQAHIITPIAGLTPRIQAMKRQLAQATGEPIPDFETTCLHAIPVQVGGLHPVSDLWYIEREIDEPTLLRQEIYGLASDVANEVEAHDLITPSDWGIGFTLTSNAQISPLTPLAAATIRLLDSLSGGFDIQADQAAPVTDLGQLMLGCPRHESQPASAAARLSDQALVKIFRVMRLARRLSARLCSAFRPYQGRCHA
jgi:hypothetical protein